MAAVPHLKPLTSAQVALSRLRQIESPPPALGESAEEIVARRRIGPAVMFSQEQSALVDDEAENLRLESAANSVPTDAPATEGSVEPEKAVSSRVRWARNVVLGASLSFADAGILALNPVRFVWQHMHTVGLAAIYLMLPMAVSLGFLSLFPSLAAYCKAGTVSGSLYLMGLYISSATVLMLGAFSAGFFWRGSSRLMDHFARRGEEAFPKR